MRIGLSLFMILSIMPAIGYAAYQDPVVESVQKEPNGLVRINVLFSGNAGEPDVRMPFIIRPGMVYRDIRVWAKEIIDDLDNVRTIATAPEIQAGQTIPRANRITTPETAKQSWNRRLRDYLRVKDSGIAAASAELASMKADLEATYQAGHLVP